MTSNLTTSVTCLSLIYAQTLQAFVKDTYEVSVLVLIVNTILPIFAVIGNTLVLVIVALFEQLKVPANYLLVNLALSDLVMTSVQLQFTIHLASTVAGYSPKCDALQTTSLMLGTVSVLVSLSTLCLITSDRFIAIVFPMRYPTMVSSRRATVAIALSWLLSTGFSLGYQFPNALQSVMRYCLLLYILGACAVMTGIHSKLFLISHKHSTQIRADLDRHNPAHQTSQEKKALNTVLILTSSFLLTYMPRVLLSIMERAFGNGEEGSPERALHHALDCISVTLLLLSSAINPYVFFLRSRRLRIYVWKLLSLIRQRF